MQQYYHFLLGYLAPLLLWSQRKSPLKVFVRDCGPMNRWFDDIRPILTVELMSVGDALHVLAGKLQPTVVLRGLDYPDSFDTRKLRAFRDMVLALPLPGTPFSSTLVSVTDRIRSDSFFHQAGAEVPMSGAERRSVPNLSASASSFGLGEELSIFDPSDLAPLEQVHAHARTRVLVGQHGAGLTNMVWMPAGSTVIEIHPPLPGEAVHTFEKLAHALGHHYVTVPQGDVHSPVDAGQLEAAVTAAVARYR